PVTPEVAGSSPVTRATFSSLKSKSEKVAHPANNFQIIFLFIGASPVWSYFMSVGALMLTSQSRAVFCCMIHFKYAYLLFVNR
ncbi:MAG: hypothetical protein LBE54_15805, partial [Brucellaceae bacterium]|nr:hypothetical protein [Brucellaceae bacterium]